MPPLQWKSGIVMLAVDTNVVLRYLVNDDPAQAAPAREKSLTRTTLPARGGGSLARAIAANVVKQRFEVRHARINSSFDKGRRRKHELDKIRTLGRFGLVAVFIWRMSDRVSRRAFPDEGSLAMIFVHKFALPLLLATIAIVWPAAAAERKSVPNSAARAIVGNTVHGVEADGEFYDYYAPNGSATSKLVSGDVTHGRWSIQNGNMCLNFPRDTPACYRVELNGSRLDMTDVSSGTTFHNQLIRGNPQHL